MVKIVAYGLDLFGNFGCPSVLHGFEVLIKELYGEECEITFLQVDRGNYINIDEFESKIVSAPLFAKKELGSLLRSKLGLRIKNVLLKESFDAIKEADYLVNLYGICFCDNLESEEYSLKNYVKKVLSDYTIEIIGKAFHKKIIKNTCSFGPINLEMNKKIANLVCKKYFDVIIAREKMSRQELQKVTGKKIFVSPDVANLMHCGIRQFEDGKIGISVSHQINRQWGKNENYIQCMSRFCNYLLSDSSKRIVIIPNEYEETSNNDVIVAQKIYEQIQREYKVNISILDVHEISPLEMKAEIASCEAVIASRYHTCVAALSTSTPLLIIGWHYKYNEILDLYKQNDWLLSNKDCNFDVLKCKYDIFWNRRNEIRESLINTVPDVKKEIIHVGRKAYLENNNEKCD